MYSSKYRPLRIRSRFTPTDNNRCQSNLGISALCFIYSECSLCALMTISITKSNPNHQNILRSQTLFSYQIRFFSSRLKKTRDPFVWGNNLFCSSVFHAISLVRFTASCIRLVNTVVFGESNTVITLLLSGHKTNHPNHIISHNIQIVDSPQVTAKNIFTSFLFPLQIIFPKSHPILPNHDRLNLQSSLQYF